MDGDDDNIILYGHPDSNYTYLDGSPREPHQKAQTALLVLPKVGFISIHPSDRELVLTRLPCSQECAERWVAQMRESLKERFIWAEIKEVLI